MKTFRLLSLLVLAVLIFNSCTQEKTHDLEKIKKQIAEHNALIEELSVKGQYDSTMLALYTDDAYSMPSYQPMIHGMDAIKAANDMMQESMGDMIKEFKLHTKDVMVSGDFVVEVGNYEITMEMPPMPEPYTDKGKYITIFEIQEDGELKIKVETWNTDSNPWQEMQNMAPPEEMDTE